MLVFSLQATHFLDHIINGIGAIQIAWKLFNIFNLHRYF